MINTADAHNQMATLPLGLVTQAAKMLSDVIYVYLPFPYQKSLLMDLSSMNNNCHSNLSSKYDDDANCFLPLEWKVVSISQQPSHAANVLLFGNHYEKVIKSSTEEQSVGEKKIVAVFVTTSSMYRMIPSLFKLANAEIPMVFHASLLTPQSDKNATMPQTDESHNASSEDHQDIMSLRETGLIMIASGENGQDTHDMAILSHLIAIQSSIPVIHFFDGLLNKATTETQQVKILQGAKLNQLLRKVKIEENIQAFRQQNSSLETLTDSESPILFNTERSSKSREAFEKASSLVQHLMDECSASMGKQYHCFEYFGDEKAEFVLVLVNGNPVVDVKAAVDDMIQNWKAKVAVIVVRVYRPWNDTAFLNKLPKSVKAIGVLDRSEGGSESSGEPLFLDVLSTIHSLSAAEYDNGAIPTIVGGSYGIGSMDTFTKVSAKHIFESLANGNLQHGFKALKTIIPGEYLLHDTSNSCHQMSSAFETTSAQSFSKQENSLSVEKPYLKILEQLFGSRALVANLMEKSNIWGTMTQETTTMLSSDAMAKNGLEQLKLNNSFTKTTDNIVQQYPNSEYGFGVHLAIAQKREALLKAVKEQLIAVDKSVSSASYLTRLLSEWYDMNHSTIDDISSNSTNISSTGHDNVSKNKSLDELTNEIQVLIENESHTIVEPMASIYRYHSYFPKFSHWIIGSDSWSDDLNQSGIHQVLASGENVNLLILDTEPYSNVTEQMNSKTRTRRKKDIGLYAMTYGSTYVASVALYDSYSNVLRAFTEADAFDGPSIVLAYAPCFDNNTTVSSSNLVLNVSKMDRETRDAVSSGYWPLYRWNPIHDVEDNEKKPFTLDSIVIKSQLRSFLERENVLSILGTKMADFSVSTHGLNEPSMNVKMTNQLMNSFKKLTGQLERENQNNAPTSPLLILIGSDNGHAEAFASKLEAQVAKSFKVTMCDMDDFPISDLNSLIGEDCPVIFICSTAGQGEFPANAKGFYTSLKEAIGSSSLVLTELKYAIFGLGDTHYWPREDEAHYFCKAPLDLDTLLCSAGAIRLTDSVGLGDDQDVDGPETAYDDWKCKLFTSLEIQEKDSDKNVSIKVTNEDIKSDSNFLRGTLATGLIDKSTKALCEADTQLTKFHGIYQQDNRDLRTQMRLEKKEKAFSFMIRVRVPGGISTAAQYLAIDSLADSHANGNIKLTTRQAYQLQGILKWDLKAVVKGINVALMDSLAACGDVNRNVMANPNPDISSVHAAVWDISKDISAHLTPQTSAYHEIWLDKKLVAGGNSTDFEPLYGDSYLPRKFKIAIAVPPSNDVDVFAHCLGFIAILDDKNDSLLGFNVSIGGGMGMTHNNKATFPRLADVIGFCLPEQAKLVAEKVMLVQRDYGDRENRKHARFKYTVEDHGVKWILNQVETLLGWKLEPARPFKLTYNGDRFGWTKCNGSNGAMKNSTKHLYTLFVEGGRIVDLPNFPLKTALKECATKLMLDNNGGGDFRLTANQNLIIGNLDQDQKLYVTEWLEKYKLGNNGLSAMRLNSIACAALPFCGLALAESERYLPTLINRLDLVLEECNLLNDAIVIRMTGCPNGCGRPYLGEIGFVGRAPGIYNLYLGAGHAGERLNKLYKEALDEDQIMDALTPIIKNYAKTRTEGEKFGDFVIRKQYVKACDAAPLVEIRAAGETFHD